MIGEHIKTIHATITAKNPTKLAEWYKDTLGIKIGVKLLKEGRPPVYFLKLKNGCEIEIHPFVKQHIGVVVDDFDKVAEKLKAKGIQLTDVQHTSGGWKIGFFKDTEGNLLELQHRPKGTPQI